MKTSFIISILLLFVVCIAYSIYLEVKKNKCFIHKWVLTKSYWGTTILIREYKCKKCNKEITTHYEI